MEQGRIRNALSGLAFAAAPEGYMQGMQMQQMRQRGEIDLQRARMEQEQAQAAARAAAMEQARGQRRFDLRAGSMFGNGQFQPQQPITPMPGQQPAPMAPVEAPPALPGESAPPVTVTGVRMRRPSMPDPNREIDQLMLQAYMVRDAEDFNALFEERRSSMTEERKQVQQQIAAVAGQILNLGPEQRAQAVMQFMESNGINPDETSIDDYINDPGRLEAALRIEMALGSPDEAAQQNIRVQGTRDEFRRPDIVDLGGQRAVVSMSGANPGEVISQFDVTADPNAVLQAQTQRRGQDVQSATSRAVAEINGRYAAQRARIASDTTLTVSQRASADRRLDREQRAELARLAASTGSGEVLGAIISEDEF